MKSPKLAKRVGEATLLIRVIREVDKLEVALKVIVFGRDHQLYSSLIEKFRSFEIVVNEDWSMGISSSIASGLSFVQDKMKDSAENCIITLADMPLINSNHLQDLILVKGKSKKGIIASNYGQACGPPALFGKKYFKDLLKLGGDQGAKKVIESNRNDLSLVTCPEGLIDIDTVEDLERFRATFSK